MSVHVADSPEPKLLNSLAELSRALDEELQPHQAPPVFALAELSRSLDEAAAPPQAVLFAEWGDRVKRSTTRRRRRGLREWWPMGIALGLLFCGVFVVGASTRRPVPMDQSLLPIQQEQTIVTVDLEDPVQQGRGGRAPNVLNPLADALPAADCQGTRISFVDGGLAEAGRQAKERHKLLMILNVSGDFDDSRFT
jgi:hypothetical protein